MLLSCALTLPNPKQFFPTKKPNESFKRKEDQAIINFRVEGIDELLVSISDNKGQVISKEETPYGDFAIIIDPFGNKIELWEAKVEAYKTMAQEELETYQKNK